MKEESLFTVPYYKDHISNWRQHKEEIFSMLDYIEVQPKRFYTDYFKHSTPKYYDKLMEILSPSVDKFCELINTKLKVVSLWSQKYQNGASHEIHNHGSLGYSAVFYANLDEKEHRGTEFISPFNNFLTGNIIKFTPNIVEGDIIFFPAVIMHKSPPTVLDSESHRIIFSMNLKSLTFIV